MSRVPLTKLHPAPWNPRTIIDTFGGTGTTAMAAEQHGRRARLMEVSPAYCDVIVNRWQKLTGKTAVLAQEMTKLTA